MSAVFSKCSYVCVSLIPVHFESTTTEPERPGFHRVSFLRGITIPSDCFSIKYNFIFIPYLLYKKTTRCTFTCVTLFETAEHSKHPGPVQTHKLLAKK